jgi:hypothetical protein
MPRAKAARMWEIAGSPVDGLSVVSSRRVEEGIDRFRPRPHRWILRQAIGIHGGAVPQRVNPGNPEWKLPALLPEEARQRAPHAAIPDQCQLHQKVRP